MRLYIGNLSYNTTEETLRTLFSNYADVASVQIMKDRFTQQSKGFGFIEIEDEVKAERAIGGMNGKDVDGRRIRVSEAQEKPRSDGFDSNPDSERTDYRNRSHNYGRRDSNYRNSEHQRSYRSDRNSGRYERDDSHSRDYDSDYRDSGRRSYRRRDDNKDSYRGSGSFGSRNFRRDDNNSSYYGRREDGNYSRRENNPDEY